MVSPEQFPDPVMDAAPASGDETAVLAGGCFWCVEAVYLQLDGVSSVKSGYAGGTADTADYETVCSGTTDHAEAVEIRFDRAKLTYGKLLKVFFSIAHDPTTRDRQGADVGRQYRSAIFYANDEQKRVAEAYHQNYAARNPGQPYIAFNALPKVKKVRQYYADQLKR